MQWVLTFIGPGALEAGNTGIVGFPPISCWVVLSAAASEPFLQRANLKVRPLTGNLEGDMSVRSRYPASVSGCTSHRRRWPLPRRLRQRGEGCCRRVNQSRRRGTMSSHRTARVDNLPTKSEACKWIRAVEVHRRNQQLRSRTSPRRERMQERIRTSDATARAFSCIRVVAKSERNARAVWVGRTNASVGS